MSDSSVERARAKAKANEWTVERILHQLDSIPQFDHQFWEHCKSIQNELVPALLEAMQQQESIARLNASLLLLRLGEPDGTDGIIACLQDADDILREKTLLHLSLLPPEPSSFSKGSPFRPLQPVPLKKEPLFTKLKPFLSQSNTYHIILTLSAITGMNPPNAEPPIRPLLSHPSRDVRVAALYWYCQRSESQRAIPVARDLLFDKEVRPTENSAIQPLSIYCRSKNEALATQAAELLARFVLDNVDYPGNYMSNIISNALSALEEAGYAEERQVVWAVFRSKVKDWRRGTALRRLADIKGQALVPLLKESLSDSTLRLDSAQGITRVSKDSGDPQLVEALIKALQNESRSSVMHNLVSALIAVEGGSTASFEDLIETLPPYDAMRVSWLMNNIEPDDAANQLVKAKVIDPPTEERMQQIKERWDKDRTASSVMINLLSDAKRLFWFDRESGEADPIDYVGLLKELIKIGYGVFDAESFSQQVDESTKEIEIQFIFKDRVHTFKVDYHGDWYDVESVLQGLNESLRKSGRRERFILLYTGDQTCAVTFAPESEFQKVAHNLRLPIEDY